MSKTIKQIADELGVSKQSVYKRYKGKLHAVCAPYTHTEQGTIYIGEQGESFIKQDFLQCVYSNGATPPPLDHLENADILDILKATIDTLQGQLLIKDKQIDELLKTIENLSSALNVAQQTAQVAQALHVGTIQQLTNGADQIDPENKKKQGLFSRLFSK